jgi:hypothetical protein
MQDRRKRLRGIVLWEDRFRFRQYGCDHVSRAGKHGAAIAVSNADSPASTTRAVYAQDRRSVGSGAAVRPLPADLLIGVNGGRQLQREGQKVRRSLADRWV